MRTFFSRQAQHYKGFLLGILDFIGCDGIGVWPGHELADVFIVGVVCPT